MAAKVDLEKCVGCEKCVEACPCEAITVENHKAVINADNCVECGACIDECKQGALSL